MQTTQLPLNAGKILHSDAAFGNISTFIRNFRGTKNQHGDRAQYFNVMTITDLTV
jgi:hypothetical protein